MQQSYWLRDWMDENGVTSVRAARKALADEKALRRLHHRVQAALESPSMPQLTGTGVVAGRGIDLSNDLECPHWDCKRGQVDRLFGRVWHYFDQIAVTVASPRRYTEYDDLRSAREFLEGHLRMLLYLRRIGAEDLLVFIEKPPDCEKHALEHLREAGVSIDEAEEDQLAAELLKDADLHTFQHADHRHYMFTHPMFEHSVDGAVADGFDESDPRFGPRIAHAVIRRYAAHLASDIRASAALRVPLGTALEFHGLLLSRRTFRSARDEVALRLNLPVLDGMPARDIVRLRNDQHESFVRFRKALNIAMSERLKVADDRSADAIASEIDRDVIEPALAEITQRLKLAQNALAKKATLSITLGGLATTCGLLTANPLLLSAGVAFAAAAGAAEVKYIEEDRDIQLADMYFLWNAIQKHVAT